MGTLEKGALVSGVVSHLDDSGGTFWLQTDLLRLDELTNLIFACQHSDAKETDIGLGDFVIGEWEGGQYRAVVEKLLDDKVWVHFVDYGNSAVLSRHEVRPCTQEEASVPYLAIRCRLDTSYDLFVADLERNGYVATLLCINVENETHVLSTNLDTAAQVETDEEKPVVAVEVLHVESVSRVWVSQDPAHRLLVAEKLRQEAATAARLRKPVVIGDIYLIRHGEDDQLKRCVVEKIHEDKTRIKVRLIDIGRKVQNKTRALLTASDEVCCLLPAALSVKMVTSAGVPDTVELKKALEDVLLSGQVTMLRVGQEGADILARFFLDGVDLDFGSLYRTALDEEETSEEAGLPVSDLTSSSFQSGIVDAEHEVAGLEQKSSVVFNVAEAVDQVWLTPESGLDDLDRVMEELDNEAKAGLSLLSEPTAGDWCASTFSEDGRWYRCKILYQIGDLYTVRFVDYGNQEEKLGSELYKLADRLAQPPPFAQAFWLDRLGLLDNSEENMDSLHHLLISAERLSLVLKRPTEGDLFIGDQLLTPELLAAQGKEKVTEPEPEEEGTLDATLGYLETVHSLWLIPCQRQPELDRLMEKIAELVPSLQPLPDPSVGTIAIHRFVDGEYYRVRVLAKKGPHRLVVHYFDYGNTDLAEADSLLVAPLELRTSPPFAVKMALLNNNMEDTPSNRKLLEEQLASLPCISIAFRTVAGEKLAHLPKGIVGGDANNNLDENSSEGVENTIQMLAVKAEQSALEADDVPTHLSADQTSSSTAARAPKPAHEVRDCLSEGDQELEVNNSEKSTVAIPTVKEMQSPAELKIDEAPVTPVIGTAVPDGGCRTKQPRNLKERCGGAGDMSEAQIPGQPENNESMRGQPWVQLLSPEDATHDATPFNFKVGDKVLALWEGERKWRHGIVEHIYKDEALIAPVESGVRPALVSFLNVKPPGTPIEALDLLETAMAQLSLSSDTIRGGAFMKQQHTEPEQQLPTNPGFALQQHPTIHVSTLQQQPTISGSTLKQQPINHESSLHAQPTIPGFALQQNPTIPETPLQQHPTIHGSALQQQPAIPRYSLQPHIPQSTLQQQAAFPGSAMQLQPVMPGTVLMQPRYVDPGVPIQHVRGAVGKGAAELPGPGADIGLVDLSNMASFARTDRGSLQLQRMLTSTSGPVVSARLLELLSEDPLSLVNHGKACYVIQKLILVSSPQDLRRVLDIVKQNFVQMSINVHGCYVVQALLANPEITIAQELVHQLEDKRVLKCLLWSRSGCYVAQACLDSRLMQLRSSTSILNFLYGQVVDVACNPCATYFLQKFCSFLAATKNRGLQMLTEDILNHTTELATDQHGSYVLQVVIESASDDDLTRASNWLKENLSYIYTKRSAVFVALVIIQQVAARCESTPGWENVLDLLASQLTGTVILGRPLLIHAALDEFGCKLCVEILRHSHLLPASRSQIHSIVLSYMRPLKSDPNGMTVIKAFNSCN